MGGSLGAPAALGNARYGVDKLAVGNRFETLDSQKLAVSPRAKQPAGDDRHGVLQFGQRASVKDRILQGFAQPLVKRTRLRELQLEFDLGLQIAAANRKERDGILQGALLHDGAMPMV